MDDQDLKNVKIPVWVIIVMVVSTFLSLGFLLVMLQRDFDLDKILYFFLSIILIDCYCNNILFYQKNIQKNVPKK